MSKKDDISNVFQEAVEHRSAYETSKEEMTSHKTAWEKSRQKVWDVLGPPPETPSNGPFNLNLPKIKKENWWWIMGLGSAILTISITVTPIVLIILLLIGAGLFMFYKGQTSKSD